MNQRRSILTYSAAGLIALGSLVAHHASADPEPKVPKKSSLESPDKALEAFRAHPCGETALHLAQSKSLFGPGPSISIGAVQRHDPGWLSLLAIDSSEHGLRGCLMTVSPKGKSRRSQPFPLDYLPGRKPVRMLSTKCGKLLGLSTRDGGSGGFQQSIKLFQSSGPGNWSSIG